MHGMRGVTPERNPQHIVRLLGCGSRLKKRLDSAGQRSDEVLWLEQVLFSLKLP